MSSGLTPHLFETLLAAVPAFCFSLRRADLSLLRITEGAADLTGFDPRDLIARPELFAERLPSPDRERLNELCGTAPDEPAPPPEDIRFRCADGRIRGLRIALLTGPVPPVDPLSVAGLAWSVEGERAARSEALRGRNALQAADVPIFLTDLSGRIGLWNAASERFFGRSAARMVGSGIHSLFPFPAGVVEGMIRRVREEGTVCREDRLVIRSGETVPCRLTASLLRDEEGCPDGMVVAVDGTAELRILESRLQEAVTRLRIIEKVNRIIASEWDIRRVQRSIVPELEKLIDFDRTSIALFEEGKDPVLIQAYSKGRTELGTGTRVPLERSAPGWVRTRRVPRIDADIGCSDEAFAENGILLREGMRSRLMIPLFAGERIVGTLNFNSRRKGAYSLDDVEGLGSIPDQLALAIGKHRTYVRLKRSEERYRLLFEQGPPTVIAGPQGRFVDVNEGFLRLFGYAREELLELSHADLFPDPEKALRISDTMKSGETAEGESIARRKDGGLFFATVNVFPVSKGLVLAQVTDVTRRRDAEEALRREKEFSSGILSVANALIVVLDREGRILLFNRKCEEVTGWMEGEVRGTHVWDALLPERFATRIREGFSRLGTEDLFLSMENPWLTRDGKERLISWSNAVVRDRDGDVRWVIGTGIDITDQRELEGRLRHAQKMEAVGTLAGGIAHDFNNIIQAVLGYASLLKGRLEGQGEALRHVDAIEGASLRAAELTSQLLGFARKGKLEVKPTDMNGVVEKVVSMIRPTFDRSIDIRTALAAGLSSVNGDAGQLEHTLLNLCINARDAMQGGGTLRIETRNETLSSEETFGAARAPAGDYVSLSVSDTGTGIPPSNLPRIFEPFFTTKEPGRGSGMGLAMVYGIVKNHGGWIDVGSEVGRGTAFRILFPASQTVPAPAAQPRAEILAGGTETILFADDEESLCALATETLGGLGYTVLAARSGAEALRLFTERRGDISLVILDLVMPEMGGAETFRRIRNIDPGARVMISSGYAMDGRLEALLSEGAVGFLQKPYRLAALAPAIRKALSAGS